MPSTSGTNRPARTLLEQLIHERNQTLEEFAAYAETFAREHNEPGTLSAGHLQRLVAGRRYDGKPLGRLRPATARLLEKIFGIGIAELLSSPRIAIPDDSARELQDRLQTSARIDLTIIALLHGQLLAVRCLDRQLGSTVVRDDVLVKLDQVERLLFYSVSPLIRTRLSMLLAEYCMLAGWQALDQRRMVDSWQLYEKAKLAAKESGCISYTAHASAQQAFVLIDLGRSTEAEKLLAEARAMATNSTSSLTRSWLAAAHGETLAADGEHLASLRAFDQAASFLPSDPPSDGPYVALNPVHLDRWRGHGLTRLGIKESVAVLSSALGALDPSFTRAETALRVDLSLALSAVGECEHARQQARLAARLAREIGSARQLYRVQSITSAGAMSQESSGI
jgi:tetratricopeptide (TPR) repeat protein